MERIEVHYVMGEERERMRMVEKQNGRKRRRIYRGYVGR